MAYIQKSNKIAFPMFVNPRCPKCNFKLENKPGHRLEHKIGNGCIYDGKTFKAPVVYLEEVK